MTGAIFCMTSVLIYSQNWSPATREVVAFFLGVMGIILAVLELISITFKVMQ